MATWREMATDCRFASYEMFHYGRWRTCVNRAYFAVDSAATEALIRQGTTMPADREGPSHAKLPGMAANNLREISHSLRWQLARVIATMYKLRIMADYMPSVVVEEAEARLSLGEMNHAFRILAGES
jgi:uncharacterized protein (UPF0332 family)